MKAPTKKRVLHEIDMPKVAVVDRPCQEPALAVIIKSKNSGVEPGTEAGPSGGSDNEGKHMSVITKMLGLPDNASEDQIAAEFTKRDAATAATTKAATDASTAAVAKLAEVQKALDDQAIFAAMSDVEKAHHADLKKSDATGAEAFFKMSPEDKKKKMKDDADGDETMKMAGITVSKRSVGAAQFEIMKAQQVQIDAQAADIAKAKDESLTSSIKADIAKNFSHVAGTEDEKVAMLKALNALPAEVQKAQRAIMTSAEALAKAAFDTLGHGGGVNQDPDSAESEVEKRSQELAKAKGIDIAKARVEFSDTADYQSIMKRAAQ